MKSFRFDPAADLVLVPATVTGSRAAVKVRLALDTGSTTTILTPEVVAVLGYGEDRIRRTVIRTPLGEEPGYLLRVGRFTSLGFSIADFAIHAHALPPGHGGGGQPLTQTSWRSSWTTSTRSAWAAMTASIGL